MINQVRKDITKTEHGVIAHGVNCQGVMGAGVALAIRNKWPAVYESYKLYEQPNGDLLGTVDFVDITDDGTSSLVVANCWTQEFYGPGNKQYASLDAIMSCLREVYCYADAFDLPVVMPWIGCGLAGLKWPSGVYPIVESLDSEFENIDTTVCVWG